MSEVECQSKQGTVEFCFYRHYIKLAFAHKTLYIGLQNQHNMKKNNVN